MIAGAEEVQKSVVVAVSYAQKGLQGCGAKSYKRGAWPSAIAFYNYAVTQPPASDDCSGAGVDQGSAALDLSCPQQ